MSRALRLLVKDGWYHVTARGNERRAIFRGDRDCGRFLAMLGELPERYGVRVAAYVPIMTAVRWMERRTEWEDVVRAVEKVKGEAWGAFHDRHGDWGRDLALAVARRRCGMTLSALGASAGGMRYGAVAAAVRNLHTRLPRDRRLRMAWKEVVDALNT